MTDVDEYILTYYGRCRFVNDGGHCQCLDPIKPRFGGNWVGTVCPDWIPLSGDEYNRLKVMLTPK